MKKLIALVAIPAGKYAADQPLIEQDTAFEVPEDLADKIVTAGDAKLEEPLPDDKAAKGVKKTKVRLLVDSAYGNANDVVEVASTEVKALEKDGVADSTKEAVAYAQTLPQNRA